MLLNNEESHLQIPLVKAEARHNRAQSSFSINVCWYDYTNIELFFENLYFPKGNEKENDSCISTLY